MTQVNIIIDDGPISRLAIIKDNEMNYDKFIEFIGGFCCNRTNLIDEIEYGIYSKLDNDINTSINRKNLKNPGFIKSESDLKKMFSLRTWKNECIVLFVKTKVYRLFCIPWFSIFLVLQLVSNHFIRGCSASPPPFILLVLMIWYAVFIMICISEICIVVRSIAHYINSNIHDLLIILKNVLKWLKNTIEEIPDMILNIIFDNYDYLQTKWKNLKEKREKIGKPDKDTECNKSKEDTQLPTELCTLHYYDKLKKLKEMGFTDENKNVDLMVRYECKLEEIIEHYTLNCNSQ